MGSGQSRRSPSVLEPLSRSAHAEVRSEAAGQFQLLFTDAASQQRRRGGEVTDGRHTGTQLLTWKLPALVLMVAQYLMVRRDLERRFYPTVRGKGLARAWRELIGWSRLKVTANGGC